MIKGVSRRVHGLDAATENRLWRGHEQDLLRYVRASGLETALKGLCGPYGVRRFVIRFSRQGQRIVLGG